MEQESIHELAGAYALDALDDSERRAFEDHLRGCDRCAGEVESLREAATALAWTAEGPAPSPRLRDRVLERARAENAAPARSRRRGWLLPAVAGAAAVAACAALGLGIWAGALSRSLDRQRTSAGESERAALVLASPGRRLRIGTGRAVVAPGGTAAVALPGLRPAPSGKTYEAWVIGAGGPRSAGLFSGGPKGAVVLLQKQVPRGARIGISLEPAGGSPQPTTVLFLSEAA